MLTPPFVPIILITCVCLWGTGGGTVHSTQRVCCTKTSVICCTQTSTFSFQRRLFNKKHDCCNNRSNNSLLLLAHGHKRLYAVRRLKKEVLGTQRREEVSPSIMYKCRLCSYIGPRPRSPIYCNVMAVTVFIRRLHRGNIFPCFSMWISSQVWVTSLHGMFEL